MAIRGERFHIDFSDDEETTADSQFSKDTFVVGEIKERSPTAPPSAPQLSAPQTGFPAHKNRFQSSKFKQGNSTSRSNGSFQARSKVLDPVAGKPPLSDRAIVHQLQQRYGTKPEAKEREEIDTENRERIAKMSVEEIEDARAELMANLNPALIQKLRKKSAINFSDSRSTNVIRHDVDETTLPARMQSKGQLHPKSSTASTPPTPPTPPTPQEASSQLSNTPLDPDNIPPLPPIHFPTPPRSSSDYVSLDPSSPSFLEDLHKHYFPDTPHEPGQMAWLNDPTDSEIAASTYHPSQSSLPISQVRFSFTGKIIPPKESIDIPVTKGLHHHGLDPASAGYTIPELGLLGRSTFPAQRCVAWQVLGRILYRLGKGEFGNELTDGLWGVLEKERVIESMMQEANSRTGHKSAQAYATEALWLWRQGGGGERGLKKIEEELADEQGSADT